MKLSFMFFSFSVLSEAFYTGFVFARGITLQSCENKDCIINYIIMIP